MPRIFKRRSRIALVSLPLFVVAMLTTSQGVAQPASFGGTVLNEAGEKPLANVEIVLDGQNRSVRSDSAGNFVISGLAPGKYTVLVRHLGFEPLRTDISLGAAQKMEVDLLIKPSVTQLANVDVKAASTASPWAARLVDFEERRRVGTGRFLTSDFFEQQNGRPLSAFLSSQVPGMKFVNVNGRKWLASTRNCGMQCPATSSTQMEKIPPACYLQIVVNGIVRYNGSPGQSMFDVDEINSKDIIGIEYYTTSTTPLQYVGSGIGGCGTMLIWTKGG